MKKSVLNDDVFYTLMWSRIIPYDKYTAARILPEMAGILCLMENVPNGDPAYLMFYGCWREGLRMGLKNLMSPIIQKSRNIAQQFDNRKLLYKYTIVDSSLQDMQDVMYWLIQNYNPEFNQILDFGDSKRYQNIYVKEMTMRDDQYIEKIPRYGL